MIPMEAIFEVLGLGLLMGVYPCSLTLNIAAVSFLSREVASPKRAMLQAISYTLGRIALYVALAAFLVGAVEQSTIVSTWLQRNMPRIVGPMFLLMAVLMLEWLPIRLGHIRAEKTGQALAKRGGIFASFLLGLLFAAAVCPLSAGTFFLKLLPLAIQHKSPYMLPAIFGAMSAMIVLVFAVIIIFAATKLSKAFSTVQKVEKVFRTVVALAFLLVGIYLTLDDTLMLHLFHTH